MGVPHFEEAISLDLHFIEINLFLAAQQVTMQCLFHLSRTLETSGHPLPVVFIQYCTAVIKQGPIREKLTSPSPSPNP